MIVLIRQKNSGDNYLLHSILDSVFGQIKLADLITVSMRAVALACDSMMLHFIYHGIPVEGIACAPKTEQMIKEYGLEDFYLWIGTRKGTNF